MAIAIASGLQAFPRIVTLPAPVQLRQVLQTIDLPQEPVLIEYRLSAQNNVWFDAGGGRPTNSLVFREMVFSSGTAIAHNVLLFQTHAGPAIGSVQIDQIITDSNGQKRPDLCRVDFR